MQNKYKLPDDVRETVIRLVKGYERRKKKISDEENEICSIGGGRYESVRNENGDEERVFQPSGKGGKSTPVEHQAEAMIKLHNSFDYRCVKAIDEALDELPLSHFDERVSAKIRQCMIISCVLGKKFKFRYSGIIGIEHDRFYKIRSKFLFLIAKKLELL